MQWEHQDGESLRQAVEGWTLKEKNSIWDLQSWYTVGVFVWAWKEAHRKDWQHIVVSTRQRRIAPSWKWQVLKIFLCSRYLLCAAWSSSCLLFPHSEKGSSVGRPVQKIKNISCWITTSCVKWTIGSTVHQIINHFLFQRLPCYRCVFNISIISKKSTPGDRLPKEKQWPCKQLALMQVVTRLQTEIKRWHHTRNIYHLKWATNEWKQSIE